MSAQPDAEAATALATAMVERVAPLFQDQPRHIISEASVRMAASLMISLAKEECRGAVLRETARWLLNLAEHCDAAPASTDLANLPAVGHG